jgi:MoxR-like ATPase
VDIMMRLSYGENEVFVSNEAGDALLQYARALALESKSDSVDISVIDSNNEIIIAHLLIGPASQLIVFDAHGATEIDDAAQVQEIRTRTANLLPDHVNASQQAALAEVNDEFDL